MWRDMSHILKTYDKLKGEMKEKKDHFLSCCSNEREKKGEEVSFQNLSLQSTEIGWTKFVGPRTKVHLLDEGYVWVPKTLDFAKDLSKEFGK